MSFERLPGKPSPWGNLPKCDVAGIFSRRRYSSTWQRDEPLDLHLSSTSTWLQSVEHHIDQRVDKCVGYHPIFVWHQQAVVEGAVQSVQDNIGIQASSEFTILHSTPNDLTGDLSTGLNPTRSDCLAQILVGLRPAEQWPEDFTQSTTVRFSQ